MEKNKRLIQAEVINGSEAKNGTLTVRVDRNNYKPHLGKIIRKHTFLVVHHSRATPVVNGTLVFISSCKPISKAKAYEVIYAR